MRKIPAALNAQFDALLIKNKIPPKFHKRKWGQVTNFPTGDRFLNYSVRWRCQFLHGHF